MINNVSSFGLDGFGNLYFLDTFPGEVYRVVPAGGSAPTGGFDCNENGQLDSCDILANPALDADGNGVIDDCERWKEYSGRVPR